MLEVRDHIKESQEETGDQYNVFFLHIIDRSYHITWLYVLIFWWNTNPVYHIMRGLNLVRILLRSTETELGHSRERERENFTTYVYIKPLLIWYVLMKRNFYIFEVLATNHSWEDFLKCICTKWGANLDTLGVELNLHTLPNAWCSGLNSFTEL